MAWLDTDMIINVGIFSVTIGTVVALVLQLRKMANSQYMELLHKTTGDLYELYRSEKQLQTQNDCELYAVRLLDIMSGLAHLNLKKKMSHDVLEFLKYDFSVAFRVLEWYHEKNLDEKYDDDAKDIWSNLTKYCKKYKISSASDKVLPQALKNFESLEGTVFVYGTLMDEIMRASILGRHVAVQDEILKGYKKSSVEIDGRTYPALIPGTNGEVKGKIFDATLVEIGKIDDYETKYYSRIRAKLENGKNVWTYVKANDVIV